MARKPVNVFIREVIKCFKNLKKCVSGQSCTTYYDDRSHSASSEILSTLNLSALDRLL
jgi:hypothetical protein